MTHAIHNRAIFTAVTLMFCFILLAFVDFRSSRASGSVESAGIATSRGVTRPAADDPVQSPEQTMGQMRNQMAALKQEMSRSGHTPELVARYKNLSDQMFSATSKHSRDTEGTFQVSAPEVSTCIAGALGPTNNTYQRADVNFTCLGNTPIVRFQNFGFNLTGCTTFPTSVTITLCTGPSCTGVTGQNMDTIIFVYRTGGATGAGGAANPFNKSSPCTNLVGLNDDGTGCGTGNDALRSGLTISLGSGHFVVVVSAFGTLQNAGSYMLSVNAPGASCALAAEPTAVEMESFTATGYDDGTLLEWRTGLEVKNLGFNVYREEGGQRSRVNEQILGGSALRVGPSISLRSGSPYAWTDTSPAGRKTRYWLEDIGLDGQSTWHGPFSIDHSSPGERLPRSGGRAQLLSKLGTKAAVLSRTVPVPRETKPEMSLAQVSAQSDLAMRPAMKLAVKQEGWYRVSQTDLAAAGFDTRTDPRMLQMFVDGQEQAISVRGEEDGRFDSSDAIEFYGVGLDSAVTDSRTYWLASGSQPGLRIERVKGKGTRAAPGSFPYTVERRDRSIYFSSLRNGDKENFFGAVIAREPVDQSISIQHLEASGSGAELELALQGVTELAHRVRVEVNGAQVGAVGFDGQSEGLTRIPLGRGRLREGENTVRLTAFGGDSDVSLVDYIRITYPHAYTADGDALRFNLSPKQQVSIDGFTSSAIRVIDITDPGAVREVTSRVEARQGSYSVTVSGPKGGDRVLLAFSEGKAIEPAALALNRPSNLREPADGADLVIISHRDFRDSIAPLKAAREKQGFSVAVVDLEDVYDAFSFGQKSPQALKDFLLFARSNWTTPPRYVLLVGDASLDPKGYLGFGNADFVPTKLIDTTFMETASDDWFVDFNGDGAADIAIGRLPVRTAEEVTAMIAKIIDYDNAETINRVMLVSDSGDDYDFAALNAQLKNEMPRNMIVQEINRGSVADAQSELIAGLDQGQKIVNYVGHGNVDQWRGSLLTSASASALTNARHLPLFVMMTCLNGYFQDASLESLAEALMKTERGGAIAVWASSGMTAPTGQAELNQQILKLVLASGNGSTTLGEATVQAKSAVSDTDVRRTWILFGDPTMRLR